MMAYLNQLDTQLFLFLNSLHLPFLDPVMILISGKLTWIPLYLFLLVLIIRYFKWQSVMILLFVALLITVSDQVSVKIFKYVFERPRPCHEPDLQALIHLPTGNCGGAYGFISSHAANSFALAGFLFLLLR
jgi:undecaprenyl-diphosphatase